MKSVATQVAPSLISIDLEFESFIWVADLTDFVLVVDEEAAAVSMSSVDEWLETYPSFSRSTG